MKRALVALAGVAGAVVVAAPVAHAGPWDDSRLDAAEQAYVNHHHNDICAALSVNSTPAGVKAAWEVVESDGGFNYHDAADIMNVTVAKTCIQFMPALQAVGDRQRAEVKAGGRWHYGGGVLA